jgi:hypothetical protein
MGQLVNFILGVIAPGISFILGLMLRSIIDRFVARRNQAFWGKGIRNCRAVIFLGAFSNAMVTEFMKREDDFDFEPTGLIGLGDARAAYEMAAYFAAIGVTADIAYTSSPPAGTTKNNIVLLGAEEANSLVRGPFQGVAPMFEIDTALPMRLRDKVSGASYSAELEDGKVVIDYGTLIRARHPYTPDRTLVMIGGLYGFGTWGGVRLLSDKDFLRACAKLADQSDVDDGFELECLYKVWVIQGEPEFVIPIEIRPLGRDRNTASGIE